MIRNLRGRKSKRSFPEAFLKGMVRRKKKVPINPKAEITPKPNVSNLAEKRKKKHFALISIDRGLLLKKEGASEN